MNILLLDHETYRIESLARGLRIMGYVVLEARSVAEALECIKCEEKKIHLIVTDDSTTILNHPQVVQAMGEKDKGIPVVMMADHRIRRVEAHSGRSDPTHLIEKPFTIAQLMHLIESLRIDP